MISKLTPSLWLALYAAIVTCLAASPTEDEKALITPGPNMKWDDLKKRYVYYVYYYVDFPATTTCGVIAPAVAAQNALWGTNAAAAASGGPFPITCAGLCANSGNYLGCVDRSTQLVATTCADYSSQRKTGCTYGAACYWDLKCSSATPFCNQNIYSGSITQFSCGISKHDPITITGAANMTAWVAAAMNTTTTASSMSKTGDSSGDSESVAAALQKIGLSVGAFVGICAGALALCCAGCFGFCWWSRKRASKQYGKTPYRYQTPAYQPPMESHQPFVSRRYQAPTPNPDYERYEQYRHQ